MGKAVNLVEGRDVPRENTDYPLTLHVRNSSGIKRQS